MEKLNILPQYIFKFKSNNELLKNTLNQIKSLEWGYNGSNLISVDHQLNKKLEFSLLHQWFYECSLKVCKELEYQCSDIQITQSWANKSEPRMWHHGHKHPNSLISGIYYLTDSNANTWFSISNIWNFSQDSMISISCKDCDIIHKQPSISGNLIIFPSNLYHSVDDLGMNTRYTISFNTFPYGRIGSINSSTYAKIE